MKVYFIISKKEKKEGVDNLDRMFQFKNDVEKSKFQLKNVR